jgi:hypothetical protein
MSMNATRPGKSRLQGLRARSAEVPASISVTMKGAIRLR